MSRRFEIVLIKPSHYDDEGYVIQWLRSAIPSNTLAVLNGLIRDAVARGVLRDESGAPADVTITAIDETNTRVSCARIIRRIQRAGGRGLVAFVGVQTNQFPRALDLARPLRAAGISVCLGGFHVSGSLAMQAERPPEIEEALSLGISLFAGEAEGRIDEVLRDASAGALKPLYDHSGDLPSLEGMPVPILPATRVFRTAGGLTSFDAGRGCPFQCSFCTIINVQGRKSRRRSVDDIERIIRDNHAAGISSYFITDDNLARNRDWEPIFDRLIALREEGLRMSFVIQVDALCHKIPRFIEKAQRAGVRRVFIGLESIDPGNLRAANKRQNRITDYRSMLQAWKAAGVHTCAGYILGFPADTRESILRDVEIIKRELPIDLLEFFCLTPLPGSEDHRRLFDAGAWMDADLNKYDLEHVTTTHPRMSGAQWQAVYREAWRAFYTHDHMERVMRRAAARGMSPGKTMFLLLWFHLNIEYERIHPLEGGYLRRKYRRDRRPGRPLESPLVFYPRYLAEVVTKHLRILLLVARYGLLRWRLKRSPAARSYTDPSLAPVSDEELDRLEMFNATAAARAAALQGRARARGAHARL